MSPALKRPAHSTTKAWNPSRSRGWEDCGTGLTTMQCSEKRAFRESVTVPETVHILVTIHWHSIHSDLGGILNILLIVIICCKIWSSVQIIWKVVHIMKNTFTYNSYTSIILHEEFANKNLALLLNFFGTLTSRQANYRVACAWIDVSGEWRARRGRASWDEYSVCDQIR